MARRSSLVPLLLLVAVVVFCLGRGLDAKAPAKKSITARKEDVKYIKCGVCEEIVKQLHRQVKKKREKMAPKKLTEIEIIDLTENICNIKKEEADWLMYLDIVEDGDRLKLVEQQEEGDCNMECKTIERACQEVMGDHDTDVAEFIFKGEARRSALSKLLCKDLSKACVGKPPAVPKDRRIGEPFIPKPSKDAEMAKLMRSMGDMPGAPGMQMFSRDELLSGGGGLGMGREGEGEGEGEDDDDDDDDVEDEAQIPEGEPFQPGLLDQAQLTIGRLKTRVLTAVNSAAQHVSKVPGHVSKWWYGSKKNPTKRKSSSPSKARSQKATKSEL